MKVTVKKVGNEIYVSCTPNRKKPITRKPKNPSNERTSQSISTAKRAMHEIALCNDWDYAVTLEFSPKVVKRMGNSDAIIKTILQWFRNLKKRDCRYENLEWLLVPEPYTDHRKKLHLHGFLRGLPETVLSSWSQIKGRKPASIRAKIKAGKTVFCWLEYQKKYGFCLIEGVGSPEAKGVFEHYIKKSLVDACSYRGSGQHLYFCSRGLRRAEVVATGYISATAEKCIKANAEKSYSHRTAPGEPIYGHTYILDDNAAQAQKIKQTIIGEA